MRITSFTQLGVWEKAHQLRLAIYDITETFPPDQRFRLTDQMQRAAHSIPSNIAEGFGRRNPPDKLRFYNISEASAEELKDALIYARDKGFQFDFDGSWNALQEVCRMLKGLIKSIEKRARENR